MIFDAHTHMGPGLRMHSYELALDTIRGEDLIAALDRAGIDRACTFAPLIEGGEFEDPNYEQSNRAICQACRRYPDRLVGYCRVNPHWGEDALIEMRRCHDEYGFHGLKLHPDWEYFAANSPIVQPLAAQCEEYGWPIFLHSGYYPLSHPTLMLPLAKRFPRVTLILAHLGYRHTSDAILVALECPNVYLETSANSTQAAIAECIRRVGPDRVLFGSDIPYTLPEDVVRKIALLPGLTEEARAKIMGGNMVRILQGGIV